MLRMEPGIRKIAVLRANGIGDFMFALPALDALRTAYPSAELVLLGAPLHRELLNGRPGPVDRVIVVPPYKGVRDEAGVRHDPVEIERFFAAMRREEFDIAIQLHGGGRNSNPFVLRLGARLTIGLRTPDAPPLDRWVPYVYYQPEIMRYLEVVSLMGVLPTGFEPRLEITYADIAGARGLVPEGTGPLVALNPGASDPRRRWPVEKFAAVGDALARDGARIIITGAASDRTLADGVRRRMRTQARDLAGAVTLSGLVGLLAHCDLVVSNDSGPLHLAAATGAATAGIFWCGNLINGAPLTRTRHRQAIAWRLDCPICGASNIAVRCEHEASFVADVEVDEVVESARALLKGTEGLQPR